MSFEYLPFILLFLSLRSFLYFLHRIIPIFFFLFSSSIPKAYLWFQFASLSLSLFPCLPSEYPHLSLSFSPFIFLSPKLTKYTARQCMDEVGDWLKSSYYQYIKDDKWSFASLYPQKNSDVKQANLHIDFEVARTISLIIYTKQVRAWCFFSTNESPWKKVR